MAASASPPVRVLGRYALHDAIASGGMATVHFGRLIGPVGFARTVAIKRLHPQFASDPEFVSMFLDEARLAARIRHPNVVPTLDVVALEGELFLVMEYIQGEPLGGLLKAMRKKGEPMPPPYAAAIVAGALRGLHAAHEAVDERGQPLGIVHRDVSPQNILVGVDGVARVLDFGVAKATGRLQVTREGQLKGKMAYMAPEQIRSLGTDRRTDIYAAGAVLWEALAGHRVFQGENDVAVFSKVLEGKIELPSRAAANVPQAFDAIVMKAMAMSPHDRYETARDMARALEAAVPLVPVAEIGEWVESIGALHLSTRAQTISRIENDSSAHVEAVLPQGPAPSSRRSLDAPGPPPGGTASSVSAVSSSGVSSAQSVSSSGVSGAQTGAALAGSDGSAVSAATGQSAVVMQARFQPRRVLAVAGAGLALLFFVAILVRALAGHGDASVEGKASEQPSAVPYAAGSPSPEVSSTLVTQPPPVPFPEPAPVPPPTSTEKALPTLTPRPSAPVTPSPPPAEPGLSHARPPPPSRAHLLDGVLDSRK
jgi:serine/threonine protein kinase